VKKISLSEENKLKLFENAVIRRTRTRGGSGGRMMRSLITCTLHQILI
jgi:hypothetical protein